MQRVTISNNSCLRISLLLLLILPVLLMPASCVKQQTVGVIFAIHGGFDNYKPQYLWDSSVQMFSYDPNHPVYQPIIWTPDSWGTVLTWAMRRKRSTNMPLSTSAWAALTRFPELPPGSLQISSPSSNGRVNEAA